MVKILLLFSAELCFHFNHLCFDIKTIFPGMRLSILKIRLSWDRLIFTMGIPILVRQHDYFEMVLISSTYQTNWLIGLDAVFDTERPYTTTLHWVVIWLETRRQLKIQILNKSLTLKKRHKLQGCVSQNREQLKKKYNIPQKLRSGAKWVIKFRTAFPGQQTLRSM